MCFLVKAHFLLAFSLFGWWIFPILATEGLEGRSQDGEPSRLPLAVDAECSGGEPAGVPRVYHHVAERASKGDLGKELQSPMTP